MIVKQATPLITAKEELIRDNIPFIPIGNYGFVALRGIYGNDAHIAQTARITTQSDNKSPRGLIRHLIRHWHTSPFENSHIDLDVALPIFVERQWARHRTAGWNEVSARYCELPCEQWEVPENRYQQEPDENSNRQGSGKDLDDDSKFYVKWKIKNLLPTIVEGYKYLRDYKFTPELSRVVLPLSTYTRKRWWVDLHNCMHFLRLRMDPLAQKEIQDYANAVYELIKPHFPLTLEAFRDFRLESVTFSRLDRIAIGELKKGKSLEEIKEVYDSKTEWKEFCDKWEKLG